MPAAFDCGLKADLPQRDRTVLRPPPAPPRMRPRQRSEGPDRVWKGTVRARLSAAGCSAIFAPAMCGPRRGRSILRPASEGSQRSVRVPAPSWPGCNQDWCGWYMQACRKRLSGGCLQSSGWSPVQSATRRASAACPENLPAREARYRDHIGSRSAAFAPPGAARFLRRPAMQATAGRGALRSALGHMSLGVQGRSGSLTSAGLKGSFSSCSLT